MSDVERTMDNRQEGSSKKRRRQSSQVQETSVQHLRRHESLQSSTSTPAQFEHFDYVLNHAVAEEESANSTTMSGKMAEEPREDLDMLLALQLQFVDSEDEDINLGNFPTISQPMSSPQTDEVWRDTQPPRRTESTGEDPSISSESSTQLLTHHQSQINGTSLTILPMNNYVSDSPEPFHKSLAIRDRYDIAGIDTYRVDPRHLLCRYRTNSSIIPRVLNERSAARERKDANKLDLSNPNSILEAVRKRHPVLNPDSGAPLVNVLDKDSFLCILDHLHFPDVFALALTCKSVHAVIDLKSRKAQYWAALLSIPEIQTGAGARLSPHKRGLCEVCLYELPESYFKPRRPSSDYSEGANNAITECRKRPRLETQAVCTDCVEFRERLETAKKEDDGSRTSGKNNVWLVWRPSQRVYVEGTGSFLWYRRRV